MYKKLSLLFIFSFLLVKGAYGCESDKDLRSELQHIRNQAKVQIPQKPDATVFAISDSLAKGYYSLAQKVCNKLFVQPIFQNLQQNLCVAVCGSVAWGEPTLKSDVEIILLLKDYKHLPETLQFTKALLKGFEELDDSHFSIDEGDKQSKAQMPSGLEKSLWTFTPQDAVDYAFNDESSRIICPYLKSIETALDAPQGSLNNLQVEMYFSTRKAIGFRKECLNVSYLSGSKEILEQYLNLRSQKLSDFNEFNDVNNLISPILYESVAYDKNVIESKVKFCWRHISNVIRTLGLLTESSEMGSFKTLNLLKERGFLSDETYAELLTKAQTHVWARLMTSTGVCDEGSLVQYIKADEFCMHSFFKDKLGRGRWFITKETKL